VIRPALTTSLPLVAGLLLVSACNEDTAAAGDAPTVTVTLNDQGCALSSHTQAAGPVTFRVTNSGSSKVTEAEIMQGDRILGEKENIAPGLDGSFTVSLKEGSYVLRCPGGTGPKDQAFTVTPGTVAAGDAQARAATEAYASYVRAEVAAGVRATRKLTDAVRAGDLAAAAAAYPASRVNWERIEPVAESFGGLDPAVDARLPDVPSVAAWTGYHRLEYAIFRTRSLTGLTAIADGLDANLRRLQTLVAKESYDVTTLANGAGELLDEVATSKITGEEEAYSHVDLVDFQGNVDGARKAFALLTPALTARDAALATRISAAFAAVDKGLAPHRTGSGPADFQRYTTVPAAERHTLAGLVDALAEPLSKVAAVLVRPAAS
jgi:iron uptake system component EfeO